MRNILLLGLFAALIGMTQTGCGSSRHEAAQQEAPSDPEPSSAKPTATSSTPASVDDSRPVIVAFGDSLTAGFGAEPGNSYADFLQKDLDAAGLHWRVVNQGVSGDTTSDGLDRVNQVLAAKPRVVIVEFGGNDGLRGLPLQTTRSNLEQMIRALQSAGVTVVLAGMTLPPNYGPQYIHTFEQIYVELAAKYQLARIPFLLEAVALDHSLMQRDGIHPTGPGNRKVAETVMKYLKPVLKAQ